MENVNRTGDFFSPLPGVRGFCGVPRGRFSFFRGHGGCRFPAGCAPHSLPRGENASRPVEERRQGNPFDGVPLDPSATTQRGGARVSPLFGNTLPGGREQATPQPRPKGRARPPFAKGGHPRFIVRSQQEGANLPPTTKVRQQKEKLRASGNAPSFFMLHMWLSG